MSPTWMSSRVMGVGLGLLALCAGLVVGSTGCEFCRCPDVDPIPRGIYEIVESPERPELVGGFVDNTGDNLIVSFTDADGEDWVIDLAVSYRLE